MDKETMAKAMRLLQDTSDNLAKNLGRDTSINQKLDTLLAA